MKLVTGLRELRDLLKQMTVAGRMHGFVPTMGALHEGHRSLIRLARSRAQLVSVSIFVNPTQFGPHEDYRRYPRMLERDCELCEREGVDVVFAPAVADLYPEGWAISVQPGPVGEIFEGRARPGHFAGVLTVVAKLFQLVQPDLAVFGQKDAQQLFLVRRMVADLDFAVRIVEGETVRESDGLALSSRNAYLKVAERKEATVLYRALCAGRVSFEQKKSSLREIQTAMSAVLDTIPELTVEYATAVSDDSFQEEDPVTAGGRLIVAGTLGSVRLIDNMPLSAG